MADMDEIYKIDDNLYIGAYWPRLNFEKIEEAGITAIVNLMEKKHYIPPTGQYAYLYKGFPDDTYPPHELIDEILNFMNTHIKEKKGRVLVHCAMGISRSGGIVIAWLLKENPSWTWSKALTYVWKSRQVLPAVEIRESILDYLETLEGRRREI